MILTCPECNKTYTNVDFTPRHTEFWCPCGNVIDLMKLCEVDLRWARERVLGAWPIRVAVNIDVVNAVTVLLYYETNQLQKATSVELLEELASRLRVSFPNQGE